MRFHLRKSLAHYVSSSPPPQFSRSACIRYAHIVSQEESTSNLSENAYLEAIIAKIRSSNDADKIFHSLSYDSTINSVQISHSIVDTLLNKFRDDWKSALGSFRWVESCPGFKPLPHAYDTLVDILGKAKQMDKMKELVKEMSYSKLVTFNTIAKVMRRFAGAGEWEEAVRIFDELANFGLEKNTESMNLLIDTLCKENKVERARAIFMELKSYIAPDAYTFNIFIHGWCKLNRVEEAHWSIQEMKGHGCRPCVISYSTIIQSYCRQSNFVKVYEILDDMKAQKCPPNIVTYTTIMSYLVKSGEFDEALEIPERVKLDRCKPDTLFYNALIYTLGKANKLEEAIYVFEVDMPKIGIDPNVSTYNTMITILCHYGEYSIAFDVLEQMEISPFCKPDAQSYYPLLKSCFKTGKIDSLSRLLDDMVNKHHISLDMSTYTLLIHGLCRANKFEWAYRLFDEMIGHDIKPRYKTCRLLLDEIQLRNEYDLADKIESVIKQLKSS